MSSTLKWRPRRSKGTLPDALKWKLKLANETVFDSSDIPFLRGLVACDIAGADKLIELILKYEEVVLNEE